MYAPLPDIQHGAPANEITVAIQYLHSHRPLPLPLQHAEFAIPRAVSLTRALQLLEHTGCGSGRLSALLAVIRDGIMERPLTVRPSELGPPEVRHIEPDAYGPSQPAPAPGQASSLGSSLGSELANILLIPQAQGDAASSSSPALLPLTDDHSDLLPPPSPQVLLESEVSALGLHCARARRYQGASHTI